MPRKSKLSATYQETPLIGRTKEHRILAQCRDGNRAEFIALYGRRRIGKTFLCRTVFASVEKYIEVTGVKNGSLKVQLQQFFTAFQHISGQALPVKQFRNWDEAFHIFTDWLEKRRTKVVLFLDELPWLAGRRTGLLQILDTYWNTRWSKIPNFVLIACGSASSWIIENILATTGGLYNRVTQRMHLHPLSLLETRDYLAARGRSFTDRQIIELYLVFGGVPYYLDLLPPGRSPTEAVNDLIFQQIGQLHDEFELLLQALFRNARMHSMIIRALAQHRYGLTRKELAQILKISDGGNLTRFLTELENCDFIREYIPFGKSMRYGYYRLIDEFSLFYLRWLAPAKKKALRLPKNYWLGQINTPAFHAVSGYNFETLCQKHVDSLLESLGISGMAVQVSTWFYRPDPAKLRHGNEGVQIDLVLDRADNVVTLCEIKYNQAPLRLSPKEILRYQERQELFRSVTGTRKTVNTVLITFSGVATGDGKADMFARVLDLQALFRM